VNKVHIITDSKSLCKLCCKDAY